MIGNVRIATWLATASLGAVAMAAASPALARGGDRHAIHIAAGSLASGLRTLAESTGCPIAAPADLVDQLPAPAIDGTFSTRQAISLLLAGTGLRARAVGDGFVIERSDAPTAATADAPGESDIVVTGSRIRGAARSSTVITVSREDIANQGQSDLGSVARALPQSFGGGQNPGLGINVPSGSGVDVGGGSSINLRGLGSDATLTLLDGRRLAFTASRQSIDVSAIPLGAVERLEVIPDGASAIYGSDAVAGVANIILKRKAEGLEVGARVGGTSDGGYFQQQYWATGGLNWRGGNAVLSYEYGDNSAIVGANRSYAANKPGLTLFPALGHHSVALAGAQAITSSLTLDLDATFSARRSSTTFPTLPSGDITLGRATTDSRDRSWVIAPSLKLALASGWRIVLAGDVGGERVNTAQTTCTATACTQSASGFYTNSERSVELGGDGRVLTLPGGDAKIAVGAGYRTIGFERFAVNGTAVNASHDQESYYGYGELDLPLVGAAQGIRFVDRLVTTAAVRYERYPGIGGVATPKLGLVWSLTPDIDVKGSWGRSFKAATQYQQYQPRAGIIYPPSSLGGSGFPAGSGVLYYQGGSPALKPERAATWSATLALHPRILPGASLDVSYFKVAYRDRIVSPVAFLAQALSNPLYAAQVTRNPSAADQAAIISSLATLFNITGVPYNPANIVAIVDNANVNAGRQTAHGVDIVVRYRVGLARGQSLGVSVNASYLESDQQLSDGQPVIPLAGRIFSPPHWRGQGLVTWAADPLTLAATLNYAAGVLDARRPVAVDVGGLTTLDLTARFRLNQAAGVLSGIGVSVSVGNVFNAKPALIVSPGVTDTPYDSTNYSPVGRAFSVAISKKF